MSDAEPNTDDRDLQTIVAAISVMRHLEGRMTELHAKLDGVQAAHRDMHRDIRADIQANGRRSHWVSLFWHVIKVALMFSGQISVLVSAWFCAGYVWFAHQTYVREVTAWLVAHLSWLWT